MSILDDARAGQNVLEKLMNAIPGFKGYRDKELRRDADKLLRESLAARLDEGKKSLHDVAAAANARRLAGRHQRRRDGAQAARQGLEPHPLRRPRLRRAVRRRQGPGGTSWSRPTSSTWRWWTGSTWRAARRRGRGRARQGGALRSLVEELDALDARVTERENILAGVR